MNISTFITDTFSELKVAKPIVHHITNNVTMNECANITLAAGGSPIMTDCTDEVAEITEISSALLLNIGTLNHTIIKSMIVAGKRANDLGIPVVFDPVGVGASRLRNSATEEILQNVKISVIKCNISEFNSLNGLLCGVHTANMSGVDADASLTHNVDSTISEVRKLANELLLTITVTGVTDIIADAKRCCTVHNGKPLMTKITGTGCMLGSLTAVTSGVRSDSYMAATVAALMMGVAGDLAYDTTVGTATYMNRIIDQISLMNADMVLKHAKIKEICSGL